MIIVDHSDRSPFIQSLDGVWRKQTDQDEATLAHGVSLMVQ